MQKWNFIITFRSLCALLTLFVSVGLAVDCYTGNELPMAFATNDNSGDTEYLAINVCQATNHGYLAGYTMSTSLLYGKTPPMALLAQADLTVNTYAYRRAYSVPDGDLQTFAAVRLSADC